MFRRLLTAVLLLVAGTLVTALPAAAAPPGGSPLVQVKSGTGNGSGFTASLKKSPIAGNVIVVIVGLDAVAVQGTLEADDISNVIQMGESFTAYQVPGAPYSIIYGAAADPAVKTWGFHGLNQKITWVAAELSGVQTHVSGVPIWEGPAAGSAHDVSGTETVLNSGHRADTGVPNEVLFATFVARVDSGTPPTVTGFSNTYPQPGTWTRFTPTVVTSGAGTNHRLDVAWKLATVTGSYDCLATWDAPPSGMTGMLTALRAF